MSESGHRPSGSEVPAVPAGNGAAGGYGAGRPGGGPPGGVGGPGGAGGPGGPGRPTGGTPTKRQFVRFAFYKLDPMWRRLPEEKQAEHKREFFDTIDTFKRKMLLRPYSLMGTRADVEMMLWQIAESIEPFQELAAAIQRTRLGAYLTMPVSLLSQTKRSIYEIRDHPGEDAERLIIDPTDNRYLFVYPFIKTRPWYRLPQEQRQVMMDEHIRVGRKYPSVKLNTTYSFGLDDQEFVVAFETDNPSDFLDLVQDLRDTEASLYTLRDVPLYTCINMSLEETLDALGGPKIAREKGKGAGPEWAAVCPAAELGEGKSKLVFLGGQQVAVFNVKGQFYAINNRCSHARGPLNDGTLDASDCSVTCPWHHAKFDLATGSVVEGCAVAPVASYAVEVRGGVVHVNSEARVPAAVAK